MKLYQEFSFCGKILFFLTEQDHCQYFMTGGKVEFHEIGVLKFTQNYEIFDWEQRSEFSV